MKDNDNDILQERFGKDAGFRVPDGYFEDFAAKMAQSLPEHKFVDEAPMSMWERIRPWAYMAAMFAGIWCTMYVFTSLSSGNRQLNPAIAEAFGNEGFVDDFMLTSDFDEYTLLEEMCSDSVELVLENYSDSTSPVIIEESNNSPISDQSI